MKEHSQFNVFHQFAGCFVPYGLLLLRKLSASAKICYAMLAQQANASGTAHLNLPMLAAYLGESERNIVRYLTELEESSLIEPSRVNVNNEDVRISFSRHPWLTEYAQPSHNSRLSSSAYTTKEDQPQFFAVESALPETSLDGQVLTDKKTAQSSRQRRKRRWFGRPRSRHTLETCFSFITYQKEVLGRRRIYDPEGLAESIYHTGNQDDEIDDYLVEQSHAA